MEKGAFKDVQALPEYRLRIEMQTGAVILFDFESRLHSARYALLNDKAVFFSVRTDGSWLIFRNGNVDRVRIGASELWDLVVVDRAGQNPV